MNLTAVLSLAVAKIDTVRHEGIADLIDAKLERGCRSKSRGERGDRSSRSRSLLRIIFGREELSMSRRENILARNIKVD